MHDSWAHGTDHPEMHTIARSILESQQKKERKQQERVEDLFHLESSARSRHTHHHSYFTTSAQP
jgi:hypothetical protein